MSGIGRMSIVSCLSHKINHPANLQSEVTDLQGGDTPCHPIPILGIDG